MKKEIILIGSSIIIVDVLALLIPFLITMVMYEIQPIATIIVELCIIVTAIFAVRSEVSHIKYVIASLEN